MISYHFNQQQENPDSEAAEHDHLCFLFTRVADTGCKNQCQDSLDGELRHKAHTP